MKKGKLIVIGGLDGCGKTLQVEMLMKELKKLGVDALTTREHTRDGAVGKLIERVMGHMESIDPVALQLCYVADRVDHVSRVIKPALDAGKLVVADRYYETTVAYVSPKYRELMLSLNRSLCVRPDLTIVIDVSVKTAIERIGNLRSKRTHFEKTKLLKRFRLGYQWLVAESGEKCVVVDGSLRPDEVHQEIMKALKREGLVK